MTTFLDTYKIYAYLDGAWVDLTSDCVKDDIRGMWGMMGNTPLDILATTGRLYFQLNNTTLKYSPNLPGVLTGWKQGVPVILEVTYDGVPYIRFRGAIDKIDITTGLKAKRVYVTVLDWMDYATKYPLTSQGYVAEVTGDEVLSLITPNMPIEPQTTDYAEGVSTFPVAFDSLSTKTRSYTEFSKIAFSEFGQIYLKKDKAYGETLVFESAHSRHGLRTPTLIPKAAIDSGFLLQENGDYLLQENLDKIILGEEPVEFESDNSMMGADISYGDQIINRVNVVAYPKRLDTTEQILYSLGTPMQIGSGETIEYTGQYTDPQGGATVNAVPYLMIDPNDEAQVGPKMTVSYTMPGIPGVITKTLKVDEDTRIHSSGVNTNYSASDHIDIGEMNDSVSVRRTLLRFSGLSDGTIPATATIVYSSLFLSIKGNYTSNARTFYVYRPKRAWVENQVTWNSWKTGSAWTAAGAFNAADCETTEIGSCDFGTTDTGWKEFVLTPAEVEEYITGAWDNNGFMLKAATESNDAYTFSSSKEATAIVDFSMWTSQYTGGHDRSTYLTVVANYEKSTGSVSYTLTNTYSRSCWIRKLQARGIGIYSQQPAEVEIANQTSYDEYGYQPKTLDQLYQRDVAQGVIEAKKIINNYKQPMTTLNKVTFCANRSGALMEAFLNLDVGDLVSIKEDDAGIDGWYYIQAVEFTIGLGGVIMFAWKVIAACSLLSGCLAPVVLDLTAENSGVNFGYLPQVSENIDHRTFSAWIYLNGDSNVWGNYIIAPFSDDAGVAFYIATPVANSLRWYQKQQAGTNPGFWETPNDSISYNNWIHVAGSRDGLAVPKLYINGVDQALYEIYPGVGNIADENGVNLVIGNRKTSTKDYDTPLRGYLKNVRIFNVILTPAEIADLALGVDITRGLVFNAPNVKTKDLDYYDNTLLDPDNDGLIDDMYGVIGSIHDPVTTQLIPYP